VCPERKIWKENFPEKGISVGITIYDKYYWQSPMLTGAVINNYACERIVQKPSIAAPWHK